MRNWAFLSCLLACCVSLSAAGCGGDDGGSDKPSGGAAGKDGAAGGGSDPVVNNPDEPNSNCPGATGDVGPHDGQYAQKGKCCYRTSNKARIDKDASTRTLEYRLNYFLLTNHQKTIDRNILGGVTINRYDAEEQSILFRLTEPQEGGKVVKGTGHSQIGGGRYNCDGTYSFYSDKAAPPDVGTKKPDRWSVPAFETQVDPSKTDKDMVRPTWEASLPVKNHPSSLPYLDGDFHLDWEGESQGFDIIQMPSGDDYLDCVGSRKDESKWTPGGKTVAFGRLDLNDTDLIDQLGVNFCQLMAFGRMEGAADHKCQDTPRCMPDSKDCAWQRLPDSLCPVTDDEMKSWGCHLGWGENPDNAPDVKPHCTKDPAKDVNTDKNPDYEGQCCDPLAMGTDGLPACNAWLQINEFVAAAVQITDKPSDTVQESCHGK
jgi:hypothetical protein